MLDSDLADLYQVPTKVLNQSVRRNRDRFPADFMLELTDGEAAALRSQFVTLEKGRGRYSKYAPYAFTEHGVAMLSSVLHSKRAVQMNILIIRAFVRLREVLATHKGPGPQDGRSGTPAEGPRCQDQRGLRNCKTTHRRAVEVTAHHRLPH